MLQESCRPVFVVGMNGSGTTMLVDSLGRNPGLYGFPKETRVIPYIISRAEQLDLSKDDAFLDLWNEVLTIPVFQYANHGTFPTLPKNWAEFPRNVSAVLDGAFRYFAMREKKIRWCEKTPQHIQHIALLQKTFPNAKFIHIIRDGRSCAASFHRRWRRTPELTIYRWKKAIETGRLQGHEIPAHYMEVKYEELTANSKYWMEKICAFLELEFHPDVLLSRRPQSGMSGQVGKIAPPVEKWRSYFSPAQILRLEQIAGAYLDELGYPIVKVAGSGEPSPLNLKYWRLKDNSHQFIHEFMKKLRGRSAKTWVGVLSLPRIAAKQSRMNRF